MRRILLAWLGLALAFNAARAQTPPLQGSWSTTCPADSPFVIPHGVGCSPSGKVYVVDAQRGSRFTGSGTCELRWFPVPSRIHASLSGLTVDRLGNVYIVELSAGIVWKFDADGTPLFTFGGFGNGSGKFQVPVGIAESPSGNMLVTDPSLGLIQEFSPSGAFVSQWFASHPLDPPGGGPTGIAVDDSGYVYETDRVFFVHRVIVYNAAHQYVRTIGTVGFGVGQFADPVGVTVMPNGIVVVSDAERMKLLAFSRTGTFLYEWGSSGSGPDQFSSPGFLAHDALGNLYVSDSGNNRIVKYGPGPVPTVRKSWGALKALYR